MRAGYKMTKLGEIPLDWEVVKLESVTLKIGDGLHATPKYVEDSEYYFVNGNNLIDGKLTITEKTKCVPKNEYDKHKVNLDIGTVLMSINGTIGNLAYYRGEQVVFGKSASYITPDIINLNNTYLYYYLQTNFIKKFYQNELTGTTIRNLSLKTIRNTPTYLPPLQEQKKIAQILSTVDEKIDLIQSKIEATQTLKKGLMQVLLTKGIGHTEFKASKLGEIPLDWDCKEIYKVFQLARGGSPRPIKEFITESLDGYNWVKIGDTKNVQKYIYTTKQRIKREGLKKSLLVQENDFILSNSMSFGQPYIMKTKGCIHDGWLLLRCTNNKISIDFMYYFLSSDVVKKQFKSKAAGSTVQNLNIKLVATVNILVPPQKEQKKIAEILSTVDEKIEILQAKKKAYQAKKKGLMQVLLTGKTRVK